MHDISVIILTYNEEIHIRRCIENVQSIAKEIFVVDCFSTDKTIEIAEQLGANVYQKKWEGNQAKQFNWALENLPIQTQWVLRLDADEYLTKELVKEIKTKINTLDDNITGIIFKYRCVFLGKWIKRGYYGVKLLRLFKYKKAIYEISWMDEHIKLIDGTSIEFENDFVDHNLKNISFFITKHNEYSIREAIVLLDMEVDIGSKNEYNKLIKQAASKRKKKLKYAKAPIFLRSFAYFFYRYIFKLGFIEGKEAFLWHFLQGWWYRTLVDAKIFEIKKACGNDRNKIKQYIKKQYNIEL